MEFVDIIWRRHKFTSAIFQLFFMLIYAKTCAQKLIIFFSLNLQTQRSKEFTFFNFTRLHNKIDYGKISTVFKQSNPFQNQSRHIKRLMIEDLYCAAIKIIDSIWQLNKRGQTTIACEKLDPEVSSVENVILKFDFEPEILNYRLTSNLFLVFIWISISIIIAF